jgi:hypothetical protein
VIRRAPGVDPHLDLKIGLFFVAAVLGLGGMLFGTPIPIYLAMVAIGVGLLLRFAARRGRPSEPDGLAGPEDGAVASPRVDAEGPEGLAGPEGGARGDDRHDAERGGGAEREAGTGGGAAGARGEEGGQSRGR